MNFYIALAAIGSASTISLIVGIVVSDIQRRAEVLFLRKDRDGWEQLYRASRDRYHSIYLELAAIKRQRSETVRRGNITRAEKRRAAVMAKAAEMRGE